LEVTKIFFVNSSFLNLFKNLFNKLRKVAGLKLFLLKILNFGIEAGGIWSFIFK
jgi:hypothetical protein